jgi:hypothetical protein
VAIRAAVDAARPTSTRRAEAPFIRSVYEWFGPEAEGTGAALLTAFGHHYVPGVLAGALALRDAGPAAMRVDVGSFVTGRGRLLSRGTLPHAGWGSRSNPAYAFRRGGLRDEPAGTRQAHLRRRRQAAAGAERRGERAVRLAAPRSAAAGGGRLPGRAAGVVRATSGITSLVGRRAHRPHRGLDLADYATRRVPAAPAGAALAGRPCTSSRRPSTPRAPCWPARGCGRRRPTAHGRPAGLGGGSRRPSHGVAGVGALDAVAAFGLDESKRARRRPGSSSKGEQAQRTRGSRPRSSRPDVPGWVVGRLEYARYESRPPPCREPSGSRSPSPVIRGARPRLAA